MMCRYYCEHIYAYGSLNKWSLYCRYSIFYTQFALKSFWMRLNKEFIIGIALAVNIHMYFMHWELFAVLRLSVILKRATGLLLSYIYVMWGQKVYFQMLSKIQWSSAKVTSKNSMYISCEENGCCVMEFRSYLVDILFTQTKLPWKQTFLPRTFFWNIYSLHGVFFPRRVYCNSVLVQLVVQQDPMVKI